jgi:hypothetical protein
MIKLPSILIASAAVIISTALAPATPSVAKTASKPSSVAVSYFIECFTSQSFTGTSLLPGESGATCTLNSDGGPLIGPLSTLSMKITEASGKPVTLTWEEDVWPANGNPSNKPWPYGATLTAAPPYVLALVPVPDGDDAEVTVTETQQVTGTSALPKPPVMRLLASTSPTDAADPVHTGPRHRPGR